MLLLQAQLLLEKLLLGDGASGVHVTEDGRTVGEQGGWLFPQSDYPSPQPVHQAGRK